MRQELRKRLLASMTEEQKNAFLERERQQEEEERKQEEEKRKQEEEERRIEEEKKAEQKRIAQEKKKKKEEKEAAAKIARIQKQKKTNRILWLSWLGLSIFFLLVAEEWWHLYLDCSCKHCWSGHNRV